MNWIFKLKIPDVASEKSLENSFSARIHSSRNPIKEARRQGPQPPGKIGLGTAFGPFLETSQNHPASFWWPIADPGAFFGPGRALFKG